MEKEIKRKSRYKYCIVPKCKNSTVKTPEKLFFYVPHDEKIRIKWFTAMKRRKPLSSTGIHVCEDHFDVENDMENYIKFKLMGREYMKVISIKKGVRPTKFACQKSETKKPPRPGLEKKEKIRKCEKLPRPTPVAQEPEYIEFDIDPTSIIPESGSSTMLAKFYESAGKKRTLTLGLPAASKESSRDSDDPLYQASSADITGDYVDDVQPSPAQDEIEQEDSYDPETCIDPKTGYCPNDEPDEPDEIKTLRMEFHNFETISLEEKVELIDKTAAWLMDENIPEESKANGVEVIFANDMIYPEIANHPILLQILIKPKDESGGIFYEDQFQSKMKPIIVKLFKSNEARVRLKLLDCFSDYVHTFTEEELKLLLLPEILKGMQDVDKTIVRATLLCLAHLVDILGPQVVIGGIRQEVFVFNEVGPREEIVDSADIKEERNDDSANESDNESDADEVNKKRKKKDGSVTPKSETDSDSEIDTKNAVNKKRKKKDDGSTDKKSNDDSANESDNDIDTESAFTNKRKKKDLIFTPVSEISKRKRSLRQTPHSNISNKSDSESEDNKIQENSDDNSNNANETEDELVGSDNKIENNENRTKELGVNDGLKAFHEKQGVSFEDIKSIARQTVFKKKIPNILRTKKK